MEKMYPTHLRDKNTVISVEYLQVPRNKQFGCYQIVN